MVEFNTGARSEMDRPDPPPGDWLFRLQGEVWGPVPSTELIDKMFSGEVDESTQVSVGDGEWRSLHSLNDFRPFLSQAKAKIRANRARAEAERAARRRRNRAMLQVGAFALVLVLFGFAATYFFILHRPWRSEVMIQAWANHHVPLLAIPAPEPSTPTETQAPEKDDKINIDQILIDDAPALVALKHLPANSVRNKIVQPNNPNKPKNDGKSADPEAEDPKTVSMTESLSNDEIISGVYARSNISRLTACLAEERRRNKDIPSKVIVSFTINNDGRVGVVRMDDFRLENGALHRCFKDKLTLLKFRAYTGERRNVDLPFNIN